eukprot:scaffold14635_cov201-Amphora_coffeaeformis.AAC.1
MSGGCQRSCVGGMWEGCGRDDEEKGTTCAAEWLAVNEAAILDGDEAFSQWGLESTGEAVIGIGGQGGEDVVEFWVVGVPGGPFGWGGEAGSQDAGDNILQGCAGVVKEVGEVGVDKGGVEEMRGGVVGKVEAWTEDVLDLAEEVKAGVGVLEDGAEPRGERELGWSRGWRVRWEGVDWEGGQVGPKERMGAWRRKLKGEWPACGCHNLGARRRRRVNRGGRSGAQRDWSGRWQRYGIGYSTSGRRRRNHQRWCSGRSPGRMTNPVVCADGG